MKEYPTRRITGHEPTDTVVDTMYEMVYHKSVSLADVLAVNLAGVLVGRREAKEEISAANAKLDELRKKYYSGSL